MTMAAKSSPIVYLGYPDEQITEQNIQTVDFTTNKIGGKPVWLTDSDISPSCKICGLNLVLVVQLYAPLENSQYHRCLYVYGCINPSCWNQSKSWVCFCSQKIDETFKAKSSENEKEVIKIKETTWCDEADDWGSDDQMDGEDDLNGNLNSDLNKLELNDNIVDNGASSISVMGAYGQTTTPVATAEIEDDESGVVEVESPVDANVNVVSLLLNVTPVPQVSSQKFQFIPLFLNFEEETFDSSPDELSDHVHSLLQNYHRENPMDNDLVSSQVNANGAGEGYEKGLPMHGDKLFHSYLTRIKRNPGQVIRYCRDNTAVLWIQPTEPITTRCKYCNGPLVFEVQLLSTLIPCLSLQLSENGSGESDHLEFGCVYIFTCAANCWNADLRFKEEIVLVQSEIYN